MSKLLLAKGLYAIGFFFQLFQRSSTHKAADCNEHKQDELDKAVTIFEEVGKELGVI